MTDFYMKCRFAIGALLPVVALASVGIRLTYLHVGTPQATRDGFERMRIVQRPVLAPRGTIYDCHGDRNILALNVGAKNVCADPKVVVASNQVAAVASELSRALHVPRAKVMEDLGRADRRFAYVRRFVPEDDAALLREKRLPGVFFEDDLIRHYPHKELMCHVLGYVNHEGVGSAGVELFVDAYLRGSPGMQVSPVDAKREELRAMRARDIPALKGADVYLTVDQNVQFIVESALEDAVASRRAKGAWAIVQRVKTGEIVAMACRPGFDLNKFQTAGDLDKLNRAIGFLYEPGSTMKAATISSALNEGTVSPETVFDCENGAWSFGAKILHDFHPYGCLTVADGIKKSSNILSAKVALTLGNERLARYLRAFGFGGRLGLDLPGEEAGILRPVRTWSAVDPTRIAIGQGVAVTALQMLGVLCAIANDGCLMRPYIVSRIVGEDGGVLAHREPEILSRPIRAETAATMRKLLARVTEDGGTGTRARVDGYAVAGKTGTAQKPLNGGYSGTYVASFVGFLPAEDPEIGMIVVIDEPEPDHTGGVVAAPVFARIASQAVRCLDIPPVRQTLVASIAPPQSLP